MARVYRKGHYCGGYVAHPEEMEINLSACVAVKERTTANVGCYDNPEEWERIYGKDVMLLDGKWYFVEDKA